MQLAKPATLYCGAYGCAAHVTVQRPIGRRSAQSLRSVYEQARSVGWALTFKYATRWVCPTHKQEAAVMSIDLSPREGYPIPGTNAPSTDTAKAAAKAAEQRPSIGRIVHYVAYGTPLGEFPAGEHRAAVITEVDPPAAVNTGEVDGGDWQRLGEPRVGLCVLNPTGMWFNQHVPYDASGEIGGTWHWPEFVPSRS